MEITIRQATKKEGAYTYAKTQDIYDLSGCIGHLRADMDTDGKAFFSTWENHNRSWKTQEFKDEFDEVINRFRFGPKDENDFRHKDYDTFLLNRTELSMYCAEHPSARMESLMEYYGFRVDTEEYVYLMRLCPRKGEYNLYCYCYKKDFFERFIEQVGEES